jgi:hypothetical protein
MSFLVDLEGGELNKSNIIIMFQQPCGDVFGDSGIISSENNGGSLANKLVIPCGFFYFDNISYAKILGLWSNQCYVVISNVDWSGEPNLF